MPKLAYINNFFRQFGDKEVQSANKIYNKFVVPKLSFLSNDDTRGLDAVFLSGKFFAKASPLCRLIREKVISFEKEIMNPLVEVPYVGTPEWEARVEEIVFLKSLCIGSVEKGSQDKLAQFVMWMKDEGKKAILFGRRFNAIVDEVAEVARQIRSNTIPVSLVVKTENELVDQLTTENEILVNELEESKREVVSKNDEVILLKDAIASLGQSYNEKLDKAQETIHKLEGMLLKTQKMMIQMQSEIKALQQENGKKADIGASYKK